MEVQYTEMVTIMKIHEPCQAGDFTEDLPP